MDSSIGPHVEELGSAAWAPDALRVREHQLAEAEAVAGGGSFEWDLASGRVTWSEGLFRLHGLELSAGAPSADAYVAMVHPEDAGAVAEAMRQVSGGAETLAIGYRVVRPGGEVRWIDVRGAATDGADGRRRLVGAAVDVTDRVRLTEELSRAWSLLRLQGEVAAAANEAASPDDAFRVAVAEVCAHTGCPVGHAYLVAGEDPVVLRPSGSWHLEHPEAVATFRAVTEETTLSWGEGLPGRVLATGAPAWIADLAGDANFPRRRAALDGGLRSAFAFPVVVGDEVVAVLEFFSEHPAEPDRALLDAMARVGAQLGRVVERERSRSALAAGEEVSRLVVETASDAFVAMAADGTICGWNRRAELLLGWTAAEAIGRPMAETIIPQRYRDAHRRGMERLAATGEAPLFGKRVELAALHRDGREVPIELAVWASPSGDSGVMNAFLSDISERRRAEELLQREREFLDAVLDSLEDGIVACDAEGRLTLFNQALREFHGLPEQPVPPERWADYYDLYHPDGRRMARDEVPLFRALSGEVVRNAEMVVAPRGRKRRTFRCNGRALFDDRSRKLGAVVAMHDVTARLEAEARLAELSLYDPLTGLANRALFVDRVAQALENRSGDDRELAVLFIDVDRFALVNESQGRGGADRVLQVLASRLSDAVGAGDAVARAGADEFVVLCRDLAGAIEALGVARRLQEVMGAAVPLGGEDVSVTVSTGVALADAGCDAARLMADAEVAARRAKAMGPGGTELYLAEMRADVLAKVDEEKALRHALDTGELYLAYQPEVDLQTDRVMGAEALLRWERPGRGLVPPLEFVPLAEETGLIVPIGTWVIEEACRQAAAWRRSFPDRPALMVSVNVSARQFGPLLGEVVRRALAEAGTEPGSLCLEVTESMVMDDVDAAIETLRSLKALGVKVAIDDFGTGYSSLAYLRRLPIDLLKIDRSFVDGLGREAEDTAIAAAIVGMAQALGLAVIAEGVETKDALDKLRSLGCDYAQGYFFSRPQHAEAVAAMVAVEAAARAGGGDPDAPGVARADTVLVVDDSPEMLMLARASLASAGFEVHEATNGADALELAARRRPETVVLDVHMPGMSGFEVCAALRADPATAGCTIVMLTATAEASDKVQAFSLGADDYMVKPYAPRELVSRVHAAVRRRAHGRAAAP